jgi:hypothetical protein
VFSRPGRSLRQYGFELSLDLYALTRLDASSPLAARVRTPALPQDVYPRTAPSQKLLSYMHVR